VSLAYVYGFVISLFCVVFGILWIMATRDLLFGAFGAAMILGGIRGVYIAGRRYWR